MKMMQDTKGITFYQDVLNDEPYYPTDEVFEKGDSILNQAKREYKRGGCKNQIVFRTSSETEGIGQFDRKWEFVIIFPYFTRMEHLQNVTSVVGYTIVKLYKEQYHFDSQQKWMNDILINCQKSVGILVESELIDKRCVLFVEIGIYVNWCPDGATSLKQILGEEVNQNQLYELLRERVVKALQDLNQYGFEHLMVRMNKVLHKRGQFCEFVDSKTKKKVYSGILQGWNEQGDLIIRDKNNQLYIVGPNLILKE